MSSASITLNSTYIDSGNVRAIKNGKVMVITGYFHLSADTLTSSSSILLFTISDCTPVSGASFRIIASLMDSSGTSKYFEVDPSGSDTTVSVGQYQGTMVTGHWGFTGTIILN